MHKKKAGQDQTRPVLEHPNQEKFLSFRTLHQLVPMLHKVCARLSPETLLMAYIPTRLKAKSNTDQRSPAM
jgi:hypothetical protein